MSLYSVPPRPRHNIWYAAVKIFLSHPFLYPIH